eukprot:1188843-Prorocentrum_minimum.AAC.5
MATARISQFPDQSFAFPDQSFAVSDGRCASSHLLSTSRKSSKVRMSSSATKPSTHSSTCSIRAPHGH